MIQPSSCSSQVSFIQGPDLEVLKIGVWWSEVLTNSPPQKKTGEGSVLTLGFKSEKNIAKTWSTEKKSKEWLWVLTPDAISCQMKHPD